MKKFKLNGNAATFFPSQGSSSSIVSPLISVADNTISSTVSGDEDSQDSSSRTSPSSSIPLDEGLDYSKFQELEYETVAEAFDRSKVEVTLTTCPEVRTFISKIYQYICEKISSEVLICLRGGVIREHLRGLAINQKLPPHDYDFIINTNDYLCYIIIQKYLEGDVNGEKPVNIQKSQGKPGVYTFNIFQKSTNSTLQIDVMLMHRGKINMPHSIESGLIGFYRPEKSASDGYFSIYFFAPHFSADNKVNDYKKADNLAKQQAVINHFKNGISKTPCNPNDLYAEEPKRFVKTLCNAARGYWQIAETDIQAFFKLSRRFAIEPKLQSQTAYELGKIKNFEEERKLLEFMVNCGVLDCFFSFENLAHSQNQHDENKCLGELKLSEKSKVEKQKLLVEALIQQLRFNDRLKLQHIYELNCIDARLKNNNVEIYDEKLFLSRPQNTVILLKIAALLAYHLPKNFVTLLHMDSECDKPIDKANWDRLCVEFRNLLSNGKARTNFLLLYYSQVFAKIFPGADYQLRNNNQYRDNMWGMLTQIDEGKLPAGDFTLYALAGEVLQTESIKQSHLEITQYGLEVNNGRFSEVFNALRAKKWLIAGSILILPKPNIEVTKLDQVHLITRRRMKDLYGDYDFKPGIICLVYNNNQVKLDYRIFQSTGVSDIEIDDHVTAYWLQDGFLHILNLGKRLVTKLGLPPVSVVEKNDLQIGKNNLQLLNAVIAFCCALDSNDYATVKRREELSPTGGGFRLESTSGPTIYLKCFSPILHVLSQMVDKTLRPMEDNKYHFVSQLSVQKTQVQQLDYSQPVYTSNPLLGYLQSPQISSTQFHPQQASYNQYIPPQAYDSKKMTELSVINYSRQTLDQSKPWSVSQLYPSSNPLTPQSPVTTVPIYEMKINSDTTASEYEIPQPLYDTSSSPQSLGLPPSLPLVSLESLMNPVPIYRSSITNQVSSQFQQPTKTFLNNRVSYSLPSTLLGSQNPQKGCKLPMSGSTIPSSQVQYQVFFGSR